MASATRVLQDADPKDWSLHRYGIPPERWKRLSTRTYWITGAGTGFGRALAVGLASAGAAVFLSGRRVEKLHQTVDEMRSFGIDVSRIELVPFDLTDREQLAGAVEDVTRKSECVHGLVNNAAVPQRSVTAWPLQEESLQYWNDLFAVNVTAQWQLSALILPHMCQSGELRILFMTSAAGWGAACGFGQYCISKAAVNSLGVNLAAECAARYPALDVQVNVLDPGQARTEMNQGSTTAAYTAVSMALILLSHPGGGPNGKFFHRDGTHLEFGYSGAYERALINDCRENITA